VDEIAVLLGVQKQTVRNWLRQGLTAIDCQRPTLILGSVLRAFLQEKRNKAKSPCPPGHIYCVGCRAPRPPAMDMADYLPITATSGNLRGICPVCEALIHRRVNLGKLPLVQGRLVVTLPKALPRIGESASPSVDCHFKAGATRHANA
jgi:hypothetical protein